jgi:hypothetical protein
MRYAILCMKMTTAQNPYSSQREKKSKSWAVLTSVVVISFGVSTYIWVSGWAEAFCENGYYFDTIEKILFNRQIQGEFTSEMLLYVQNTVFAVQVSGS